MKLFNRNKDTSDTTNDIQNYYAEEHRERTGVAWLLAAATLVVTLLLALGIFYGGRWAYRAIFDDNESETETVQQEVQDEVQDEEQDRAGDDTDEQPASAPSDEIPGDSTDEPEAPAAPSAPAERDTSALPSSGPLPATGPTEPEL